MKNILVTGGAGYIGSHITELFLKKKFNVIVVDNLSSGFKKLINKKSKFYKLDIKNESKLRKIINLNKIDTIIHLAGSISINDSDKNPNKFYNNNVNGTKHLLNACSKSLVKNFVFSSTAAVYADTFNNVKEASEVRPKSVYGKTKKIAENIIKNRLTEQKINFAILRYFNVVGASPSNNIGPLKKNDTLFKNISSSLFKKKSIINVYGNNFETKDFTCIRDYIHVTDLSLAHLQILKSIEKNKKSIILNCGYGKGISVLEVINAFTKISKKKIKIIIKKKRTGDLAISIADIKRLKETIRWKPKYNNISKIVKSCLKWEKKLTKKFQT